MFPVSKRLRLRLGVVALVAGVALFVATGLALLPGMREIVAGADEVVYDAVYKLRPQTTRPAVPIVLVEVDQASLDEVALGSNLGWPWPRLMWGHLAGYFQEQGAKAVVFDLHFSEPSSLPGGDDDAEFAAKLDALTVPLVISGGTEKYHFWPPVRRPVVLADVQISETKTYRTYRLCTPRGQSLALAAIHAAGLQSKLPADRTFRVLYHGPHRTADGRGVYPAIKASSAYLASYNDPDALPPDTFKDKIVVIGSTAPGLGDLKLTPVDELYPGVEFHAVAIDNLLSGEQVRVVPLWGRLAVASALALGAAAGVILVRRLSWKVRTSLLYAAALILACVLPAVFVHEMIWLPPVLPLLALLGAVIFGLVWTYRIEDARAKALLKALGQCVSPHVASQLADEPEQLRVGGERREMTVLFSDIAGFTDLTERLRERIEPVLNFYLAEMSQKAFAHDGTIDKFIGDAMMIFWNAPLSQPDHAVCACRAALSIAAHEKAIAGKLGELGATDIHTRIGINTGPVVVGFFGSQQRLSYTAIGDAVNLAARLEPGNKIYGSQILVSESTVRLAEGEMLFRKLDRLRVYGRDEPAEVYELLGPRDARGDAAGDATHWLAERFTVAVDAYFDQNWQSAAGAFDEIHARFPDDGPTAVLRGRVDEFRRHPPPANWDGVYTAKGK